MSGDIDSRCIICDRHTWGRGLLCDKHTPDPYGVHEPGGPGSEGKTDEQAQE